MSMVPAETVRQISQCDPRKEETTPLDPVEANGVVPSPVVQRARGGSVEAITTELRGFEERLCLLVEAFQTPEVADLQSRIKDTVSLHGRAWSGSWIGYQANTYIRDFEPRTASDFFDSMYAGMYADRSCGTWAIYPPEPLADAMKNHCGATPGNALELLSAQCDEELEEIKREALGIIDVLLSIHADPALHRSRDAIDKLKLGGSPRDFLSVMSPNETRTADQKAADEGLVAPAHLRLEAMRISWMSRKLGAKALADLLRQTRLYLERKLIMHREGSRSKLREVLAAPAPDQGTLVSAGRDFNWISQSVENSRIQSMSGLVQSVSSPDEAEMSVRAFESDLLEVLHMLANHQDELDAEMLELKHMLKRISLGVPDAGTSEALRTSLRELVTKEDLRTLARIKDGTSQLALGVASSAIFQFLQNALL